MVLGLFVLLGSCVAHSCIFDALGVRYRSTCGSVSGFSKPIPTIFVSSGSSEPEDTGKASVVEETRVEAAGFFT